MGRLDRRHTFSGASRWHPEYTRRNLRVSALSVVERRQKSSLCFNVINHGFQRSNEACNLCLLTGTTEQSVRHRAAHWSMSSVVSSRNCYCEIGAVAAHIHAYAVPFKWLKNYDGTTVVPSSYDGAYLIYRKTKNPFQKKECQLLPKTRRDFSKKTTGSGIGFAPTSPLLDSGTRQ